MNSTPSDGGRLAAVRGYIAGRVIWNLAAAWSGILCASAVYTGKRWYVVVLLFLLTAFLCPADKKDTLL